MTPTQAVSELIERKWTETQIGQEVGASQVTINRIRRGRNTTFELGTSIIRLAEKIRQQPDHASSDHGQL